MYAITKEIIQEGKFIKGIFCLSNAATYFGLGTNRPKGFDLLTTNLEVNSLKKSGIVIYHGTNDIENNLIKLPSGNYVTNLDRTILELMNYLPEDEFTSQEMEDYDIETKFEYLTQFNQQYHYCSDENFNLAIQCYNEWIADPY